MTKGSETSSESLEQAMQRLNTGFPSNKDLLFLSEQGFDFVGTPFEEQYLKARGGIEIYRKGNEKVVASGEAELRAKELLGKDFLGVEAVQEMENKLKTVGVNVRFVLDKLPPCRYTEEDLQAAKANGEMLVLRPEAMLKRGIELPLTLIEFTELFRKDPLGKMQTVIYAFNPNQEDWYKGEKFATSEEEIKLGWSLVKKDFLDGSTKRTWNGQQELLEQYEARLKRQGAKNVSVGRRSATEAVYDELLYYVNTGERLLSHEYDWTLTCASNGRLVYVGYFNERGLSMFRDENPETSASYLGVCPSR